MTVDELIAQLQALPPEVRALPVVTHETGSTVEATEVMEWHREWTEPEHCVWIGD